MAENNNILTTHVLKKPMNSLEDDDQNPVDFNGETSTFVLNFVKIEKKSI